MEALTKRAQLTREERVNVATVCAFEAGVEEGKRRTLSQPDDVRQAVRREALGEPAVRINEVAERCDDAADKIVSGETIFSDHVVAVLWEAADTIRILKDEAAAG